MSAVIEIGRLPSYARRILDDRLDGREPDEVHLYLSPTHPRDAVGAFAWIKPEQYRPRAFDWRWVSGLPVHIHCEVAPDVRAYCLLQEVAQYAAPVTMTSREGDDSPLSLPVYIGLEPVPELLDIADYVRRLFGYYRASFAALGIEFDDH